jgi:hypothetical protein
VVNALGVSWKTRYLTFEPSVSRTTPFEVRETFNVSGVVDVGSAKVLVNCI